MSKRATTTRASAAPETSGDDGKTRVNRQGVRVSLEPQIPQTPDADGKTRVNRRGEAVSYASGTTTTTAAPQALPHPTQPHHGPLEALHQPFEWLSARDIAPMLPAARVLALVNRSLDVANGVSLTLRMLEQIQIDEGCTDGDGKDCRPLLRSSDAGHLLRLAMVSSDMLAEDIDRFHDFARGYSRAYAELAGAGAKGGAA